MKEKYLYIMTLKHNNEPFTVQVYCTAEEQETLGHLYDLSKFTCVGTEKFSLPSELKPFYEDLFT